MKKYISLCIVLAYVLVGCDAHSADNSDTIYDTKSRFSIGEDKQIVFAPGNLQYHPQNKQWRFAPAQYECIGLHNSQTSNTYNGWIDLFGWGTGSSPVTTSVQYSDYANFVDWGENKIGEDDPNVWRTLTKVEWEYLLHSRTHAPFLKGIAKVGNTNGLIMLPDMCWLLVDTITGGLIVDGVRFRYGLSDMLGDSCYEEYQAFSIEEWSKLEAIGAIFLPAAGSRFGLNVRDEMACGGYWSATGYSAHHAYYITFNSREAGVASYYRDYGRSVRLVKDLK